MSIDRSRSRTSTLMLAALGVVYGDIGTSPLYAFREAFSGTAALAPTEANVLAALSALFWAITLVVSIKYVWLVLRFDNDGEGGVLALTALTARILRRRLDSPRLMTFVATAGVFAAALFYGDAVITPAISVLSAVEGLSVATPHFERFIVPITIGVLVGLFLIQRRGTGQIGAAFGPITLIWFLCIGALGLASLWQNPSVLRAIDPSHAARFVIEHTGSATLLLSAVFLSLTGGEALYADMGHFGPRAVRLTWYALVCPSLLLNYFGQGALVLRDASAVKNPFFLLAPEPWLLPLVVLATAATVIASQATISGAFSLTQQASRLGYLPRVQVRHTSDRERGQIYVPGVNALMLVAVVALVLEFRSSNALAGAYGVAVSGTMLITTALTALALFALRGWRRRWLLPLLAVLALLELAFFASNLMKIVEGGWFPLLLGGLIFLLLMTWKRGVQLLREQRERFDLPVADFGASMLRDVPRVAGTAVYLSSDPARVPAALFHNLKHYHVLHQRLIFLHIHDDDVPYVNDSNRMAVTRHAPDLYSIALHFGYRETPDVPAALAWADEQGLHFDAMDTTYFVSRPIIVPGGGGFSTPRFAVFSWMTRQAQGATGHFALPPNRVVELGTQVTI